MYLNSNITNAIRTHLIWYTSVFHFQPNNSRGNILQKAIKGFHKEFLNKGSYHHIRRKRYWLYDGHSFVEYLLIYINLLLLLLLIDFKIILPAYALSQIPLKRYNKYKSNKYKSGYIFSDLIVFHITNVNLE